MEMGQAVELLGTFTAEQWGMVTSQQARGLDVDGVTLHRLEKAGHLDRVRRGVYASTTATVTAAREEQAAWLALNASQPAWKRPPLDPDGGVLSHQSAARLHGLGELVNDRIALTTPRRRTSRDPDLWFKTAHLADDDVTVIDGLPVTTALRTICDLLDQHIDGSHVATIIRQAVEANLVHLDVLAEHIGPYALRYGVRRPGDGEALLERLLAELGTTIFQLAYRPAPPRTAVAVERALNLAEYSAAISPILQQTNEIVAANVLQGIDFSGINAMSRAMQQHQAPSIMRAVIAGAPPQARGGRAGDTTEATGPAADGAADNDGKHGTAATEHTPQLPRLPEEQGAEQVEGDRHPRR
jgi:predicted transcriptional regulator of viral defense system